eukprot:1956851-Pyramimonas_sp.AAC.1
MRTVKAVYDWHDKTNGENGGTSTPPCLLIPWNCKIYSTKDAAWYLRNGLRLARVNISVDRLDLRLHRSTRVDLSYVEIWRSRW